ncbi:hypothetical protein Tco_0480761 [Tanacetum coccineum]
MLGRGARWQDNDQRIVEGVADYTIAPGLRTVSLKNAFSPTYQGIRQQTQRLANATVSSINAESFEINTTSPMLMYPFRNNILSWGQTGSKIVIILTPFVPEDRGLKRTFCSTEHRRRSCRCGGVGFLSFIRICHPFHRVEYDELIGFLSIQCVATHASAQNDNGSLEAGEHLSESSLNKIRFRLSTTPFCSGVSRSRSLMFNSFSLKLSMSRVVGQEFRASVSTYSNNMSLKVALNHHEKVFETSGGITPWTRRKRVQVNLE